MDLTNPADREWRRRHLPGRPGKIDRDPEVRAFIEARIATMTFPELEAAARGAFGRARAPSRSAIHRWWSKNKTRLLDDGRPPVGGGGSITKV